MSRASALVLLSALFLSACHTGDVFAEQTKDLTSAGNGVLFSSSSRSASSSTTTAEDETHTAIHGMHTLRRRTISTITSAIANPSVSPIYRSPGGLSLSTNGNATASSTSTTTPSTSDSSSASSTASPPGRNGTTASSASPSPSSATASPSSSSYPSMVPLPPACDPANQPLVINTMKGTISVGTRAMSLRRRQRQQRQQRQRQLKSDDDPNPPPITTDDDGSAAADDDDYAESSVPPALPGPGPYLQKGMNCLWAVAGGGSQRVSVTWQYVHMTAAADSSSPCADTGNSVSLYNGQTGEENDTSDDPAIPFQTMCWFETNNSQQSTGNNVIVSNSSVLFVAINIVDENVATGFQIDFEVIDPPTPSAQPSPSSGASPLPSPSADPDVNCTVTSWSSWGNCSVSCGGGVETRTRQVLTPASGENGLCPFALEDTQVCNTQACGSDDKNIDCVVSNWTSWTSCRVSSSGKDGEEDTDGCGVNGTQSRTRSIQTPSSGKGIACPLPSQLEETQACSVPCIVPACAANTRPLIVTPVSGSIGIGSSSSSKNPDPSNSDGFPPPRTPGNDICGWILNPAATSWVPPSGSSVKPIVNLTLTYLNIPESIGCSKMFLRISSLSSGQLLHANLCGGSLPQSLLSVGGVILSAPGDGLKIELNTTGLGETYDKTSPLNSVGFQALYTITSETGPSPPPPSPSGPSQPPSEAHKTVTINLQGTSRWNSMSPATIITGMRNDLSQALLPSLSSSDVDTFRFSGFAYQSSTRALSFQILAPITSSSPSNSTISTGNGGSPSTYSLLTSLYTQLNTPGSRLLSPTGTTISKYLDTSVFNSQWTTPATAMFVPANIVIQVPYIHPLSPPDQYTGSITIRNTGGAPLVVPSATFTYAGGGNGNDPSSPPYGTSLFSLVTSSGGAALVPPFTVPSGGSKNILVNVDGARIPAGSIYSAFCVLQLEHNDPVGPHAIGLTVSISNAPGPSAAPSKNNNNNNNNNSDDLQVLVSSLAFRIGMGAGVGALIFSVLCIACSWCWCCRRNADGVTLCSKYCCKKKKEGNGTAKNGSSRMGGFGSSGGSSNNNKTKDSEKKGRGGGRRNSDVDLDLGSTDDEESNKNSRNSKKNSSSSSNNKSSNNKNINSDDDEDEDERRGLAKNKSKKGSSRREKNIRGSDDDDEGGFQLELTRLGGSKKGSNKTNDEENELNDIGRGSTKIGKGGQLQGGSNNDSNNNSNNLFGGLSFTPTATTTISGGGSLANTSAGNNFQVNSFGFGNNDNNNNTASSSSSSGTTTFSSGFSFGRSSTSSVKSPSSSSSSSIVKLRGKPVLRASEFESRWPSMPTVEVWGANLRQKPADGELEKALSAVHISCMASGSVGGVVKYYFYGQGDDGTTGLESTLAIGEVSITTSSLRISAVIKASNTNIGNVFTDAFKNTLSNTGLLAVVVGGASSPQGQKFSV